MPTKASSAVSTQAIWRSYCGNPNHWRPSLAVARKASKEPSMRADPPGRSRRIPSNWANRQAYLPSRKATKLRPANIAMAKVDGAEAAEPMSLRSLKK